jgi:hypothetical protein
MSSAVDITQPQVIHYPESDGQPMAENTRQFRWMERSRPAYAINQ